MTRDFENTIDDSKIEILMTLKLLKSTNLVKLSEGPIFSVARHTDTNQSSNAQESRSHLLFPEREYPLTRSIETFD